MNELFSGKIGLAFHRNMLEATAAYGARISKDFEKETGLPVKFDFINRSLGGMKLRFRSIQLKPDGSIDFNSKMKAFLNSRKNYLKAYMAAAMKATIDNKPLTQELRILDPTKTDSSQWMGDSISVKVK
jgi:hypothetical protein